VPGLVSQNHDRFEAGGFMEGLVELYYEDGTAVVEQTVDSLNDLLLGHVQVDQFYHSAFLHASE
jgi:hypothetical protein